MDTEDVLPLQSKLVAHLPSSSSTDTALVVVQLKLMEILVKSVNLAVPTVSHA